MLSIEVCRKILGVTLEEISNEQINEIRETLYQVATILVGNYTERTWINEKDK